MVEKILNNLQYVCAKSSFMGCLKGIADYYSLNYSLPWLFAASGHAFLINIHDQICPSGPYCWDFSKSFDLLSQVEVGFKISDLGFFNGETPPPTRSQLEEKIRSLIDHGIPLILLNMDFQIIKGYNDNALLLEPYLPKIKSSFPPKLTYSTWNEFNELHMNVFSVEKVDRSFHAPKKFLKIILDAALQMGTTSNVWTNGKYSTGLAAYDRWMAAKELGDRKHWGHHWNGLVWSESREMASKFFLEIAPILSEELIKKNLLEIAKQYHQLADTLNWAANMKNKNLRLMFLKKGKAIERSCLDLLQIVHDQL